MPVFLLDETLNFPPVELAEPDGVLAVGGDLSPKRLLTAYRQGIFPWYGEKDPIIWWSPDPRLILYPEDLKIARSMRPILNQKKFRVTFDTCFSDVVAACAEVPRDGQDGTWITHEMRNAYQRLHELGWAHSVEVWQDEELAGGLYGISIGKYFFGESMFSHVSNASKTGFIHLVLGLDALDFKLVDCQVYTRHLDSLGAREIPRKEFISLLKPLDPERTIPGPWTHLPELQSPWEDYKALHRKRN